MNKTIIQKLVQIAGQKAVLTDLSVMPDYSHDESSAATKGLAQAVVKPQDAVQVSQILALADRAGIPVTARAGATGLCGGCAPVSGGIVLSLERLNKVLEIDQANMLAVVEAGVTLSDFCKKIEPAGLFFPPHPGDEGAQIGGVIATNAGGSRAVKYGIVRNYVRGLEVVLAGGEIISLGGKFAKNSSGYSLLNLFIGSEGTLGIITKAIIALIQKPAFTTTLLVPFSNISDAVSTAPRLLKSGFMPMAVEFMGNDIVEHAQKKLQYKFPCKKAAAYLLIILDGHGKPQLDDICRAISEICLENKAEDVFVADSELRQKELLDFRAKFYEVLKPDMAEDLDLAVPVSQITKLTEFVQKLQDEHGIWMPTYGHAADGNVHVHIMKSDEALACRDVWPGQAKILKLKKELYQKTKELGGMLSGEHGIGFIKVDELPDFVGETQVELMKKIKKAFDPKGILNPGKIFR